MDSSFTFSKAALASSRDVYKRQIQRPLEEIAKASGKYISRGVSVDSLDTEKRWNTHITVKEGDVVGPGSIIAETQETDSILHKSMVPPNLTEATVIHAASDGAYTILEPWIYGEWSLFPEFLR